MSQELVVECARAIVGGAERTDFAFLVRGEMYKPDARIDATGTIAELRALFPDPNRLMYSYDEVVAPGFVNGHSHAYQILLRGWADDRTFESWRSDALYRVVPQLTPDDIFVVFCAAFLEMLAHGITTVVEFFYLNGAGIAHAEAAIRAAHATGIRLVLARTWMDAEYAPPLFRESIAAAARDTERLIQAHPEVPIWPAPHSLHAASPEMIRESVTFARAHGLPAHIHVAEAAYEGDQLQARTGMTPVAYLAEIGALFEGLVAVHAIYVSDDEKKMLAEAGASIVHNPMTNQYLGDGICDVVRYRELGVPIALGTDADVHPSIIEEMRAAALLQKVMHRRGDALEAGAAWEMGTAEGGRALRMPVGDLQTGMFADYVVLTPPSDDFYPWTPLVNGVVYAADRSWVKKAQVGFVDHMTNHDAFVAGSDIAGNLAAIQKRLSF